MITRTVVLGASVLAPVSALDMSPVSRVVELVRQLRQTIEADGKTEQQVYDKFACWCEETTNRKNNDIDTANDRINELSQAVQENSGRKGIFEAEIVQLKKDLAANLANRASATEIRKKQNEVYTTERLETEQCISALEHATKVLDGAGTGKTSNLQQAETLSIVKGIDRALSRLPIESSVTDEQREMLSAFLVHPQKHAFLQASHNPFGDYAPQSTQVVGIMKNMYDTFVAQLERDNAQEANEKKAYDELLQTKTDEYDTLQATLTQKQTANAENGENLAEQKLERANLQKQASTDKAFLEETKKNCRENADAWSERSRLRTEELGGIDKAIKILNDKEELFHRASDNFVQVGVVKPHGTSVNTRATVEKISALAQKHNSMRLAALAVKVKTTGHFDDVIKIIDNMIATVRNEDVDDIASKKGCKADYEALKSETGDLSHYLQKNGNLLALLEEDFQGISKRLGETEEELDRVNGEIDEALAERTAAKQEFEKALQDDKDASATIGKAIEALSAYYENNHLELGAFAQEPTYTDDPDKAPKGFAGGAYKGRKSESTGIVAILKMLREDVDNEIKESVANEAEAQKNYEETRAAARANVRALKETQANLEAASAKNSEKAATAEKERNNIKNLQGSNGSSFKAHCGECQWIYSNASAEFPNLSKECGSKFNVSDISSFDVRAKARKDEIQGLQDARSSLAGAAQDDGA